MMEFILIKEENVHQLTGKQYLYTSVSSLIN